MTQLGVAILLDLLLIKMQFLRRFMVGANVEENLNGENLILCTISSFDSRIYFF